MTAAPLRLLYVTDGFAPYQLGGMQSYARRQLDLLAAAGVEVTSISGRGDPPPASEIGWRNIALPWPQRSLIGRFSPWRYANDLKAFSRQVTPLIESINPDIVYSEGPLVHDYLHRPTRPALVIFNPHGLEMFQPKGSWAEDLKSWPLRGIVADHARRADWTVSLSAGGALKRMLIDRIGVPEARIAVLPNAAPAAVSPPRTGRRGGSARFLFVGRDEPRKALPLLIDAIRDVPDCELDVVGSEAPTGACLPHIRFHGPVADRERVRRFYADADFLVAPSHAEGMPTVVLEAFAAALPVIVTDVGANGDMVGEDETGFLIPRADRNALVDAMHRAAVLDDAGYAAMSQRCAAAASGRFSAEEAGRQLLSLLDHAKRGAARS